MVNEMTEEIIERCARTAHEVNRAYCVGLGDDSQPPWSVAPDWQRESARVGVRFILADPAASASASHQCWVAEKERGGWTYGPLKDPEHKRHPCLMPFEDLPVAQQTKDVLFRAVVRGVSAGE